MGGNIHEREWDNRIVRVKKDELLAILRENRTKHVAEFNEAADGYKEAAAAKVTEVMEELKAKIEGLKSGEMIELAVVSFDLAVPRSYEKSYNQAIRMMEMSVDEVIELPQDEFACYVMDDWDWMRMFKLSNSRYAKR